MQTIGERLEEARKRKGISLREAAEVTKIRSDFLGYLEQNQFDFDLPEIYRRGFIKNYARYLKLDADKIITDYHAQRLSQTRGKRPASEWFSSAETKEKSTESAPEERTYGTISAPKAKPSASNEEDAAPAAPSEEAVDTNGFYLKIGLILAGTVALVIVLFGLVRAIIGAGSNPANDSTAVTSFVQQAQPQSTQEFKLTAKGGDSVAVVLQVKDSKIIFQELIRDGDTVVIEKDGPVDIALTQARVISIENGGEVFSAGRNGETGSLKVTLP